MAIDQTQLDDPKFKKKLLLVDEILINTPTDDKLVPRSESWWNNSEYRPYKYSIDCNEVYNQVIVGNAHAARNKQFLKDIGVTHVLNCAQGNNFNMVATDEAYYRDVGIRFKGLHLDDIWMENISRYFEESADFIDEAVRSGGKVLIHCMAGISRSATMAIAFLMLRRGMPVEAAVEHVKRQRYVRPNEGFLRQLVQLDLRLHPN